MRSRGLFRTARARDRGNRRFGNDRLPCRLGWARGRNRRRRRHLFRGQFHIGLFLQTRRTSTRDGRGRCRRLRFSLPGKPGRPTAGLGGRRRNRNIGLFLQTWRTPACRGRHCCRRLLFSFLCQPGRTTSHGGHRGKHRCRLCLGLPGKLWRTAAARSWCGRHGWLSRTFPRLSLLRQTRRPAATAARRRAFA